jgi:hypothetical protein
VQLGEATHECLADIERVSKCPALAKILATAYVLGYRHAGGDCAVFIWSRRIWAKTYFNTKVTTIKTIPSFL